MFPCCVSCQEILKYRDLKSGIPKGDKGISWDGHITVFDGKGRTKNNFEYNINVQVKGRIVKKIKKGNTKFSIEKSDLVNYQKQKNDLARMGQAFWRQFI